MRHPDTEELIFARGQETSLYSLSATDHFADTLHQNEPDLRLV